MRAFHSLCFFTFCDHNCSCIVSSQWRNFRSKIHSHSRLLLAFAYRLSLLSTPSCLHIAFLCFGLLFTQLLTFVVYTLHFSAILFYHEKGVKNPKKDRPSSGYDCFDSSFLFSEFSIFRPYPNPISVPRMTGTCPREGPSSAAAGHGTRIPDPGSEPDEFLPPKVSRSAPTKVMTAFFDSFMQFMSSHNPDNFSNRFGDKNNKNKYRCLGLRHGGRVRVSD